MVFFFIHVHVLGNQSSKYWNDNTRKEAIKWLVEEKLKLTCNDYDKVLKIDRKIFAKYGLYTLIHKYFGDSVFKALDFAYPNIFKYEDFKDTINNNIRNKLIEYNKRRK